jgi:hypothetical protein
LMPHKEHREQEAVSCVIVHLCVLV